MKEKKRGRPTKKLTIYEAWKAMSPAEQERFKREIEEKMKTEPAKQEVEE